MMNPKLNRGFTALKLLVSSLRRIPIYISALEEDLPLADDDLPDFTLLTIPPSYEYLASDRNSITLFAHFDFVDVE